MNAGMTLHVETLYGDNGHHIANPASRIARALRIAVCHRPARQGEVLSTKGTRLAREAFCRVGH